MSDRKRPHEGNGDASAAKKLKSDSTPSNGAKPPAGTNMNDIIAQKKAEIAAKLAAMQKKAPGLAPVPQAMASSSASVAAAPMPAMDDIQRKIAEARKRVADAQTKIAAPYIPKKKGAPPPEPVAQGAGLKMAAHPLLLDTTPAAPQSKKDRYKPMQPKFASIKANIRNAPPPTPAPHVAPTPAVSLEAKANPYISTPLAAAAAGEPGDFEGAPRERAGRKFRFNAPGKHTALADELRKEAKLEALKQQIAARARAAGLDGEFETVERSIRRPAPPDAEWWDAGLLPHKTYDDLATHVHVRTADSPITLYVQHPIPIPAPGDKERQALKPLKLTSREQKKMRKRRRQEELQDKRDRIRMGLIPPDPPKVRLANVMKVLTSDAVQDPTKVEARVRREVAQRRHGHEKMNAARKLTDDQRRAKLEEKKAAQEKRGVHGAVFRVRTLADPAHRFKVRKNAEQMALTGLALLHPAFSMVYVEGAAKFVRQYKKLMLARIAWTEAARARGEDVEVEGAPEGAGPPTEQAVSLEDNRCDLVWEGPLRERAFSSFKPKSVPTDGAAKEALGQKLASYWDMTKHFKPGEEDLF